MMKLIRKLFRRRADRIAELRERHSSLHAEIERRKRRHDRYGHLNREYIQVTAELIRMGA